jgi:hypothetical protein
MRLADAGLIGHRELPTATGAAAGQHVTAVLGLHTLAETMRLGALPVIGLECSLWHFSESFWRKTQPYPGRVRTTLPR